MKKHIKKPFVSNFSKKAGQGKQYHSQEKISGVEKPKDRSINPNNTSLLFSSGISPAPNLEKIICPHDSYCVVKPLSEKEGCSLNYFKTCQSAKFYARYGKEYNQLGVGS